MRNILKTKLFSTVRKSMTSGLMTWSILILGLFTVCLVSGCRLFTIGD